MGSDPNYFLWRFWNEKARELATENVHLREELAEARNKALEDAASLIEHNIIMNTHEGKELRPRGKGNVEGLAYASAIRNLKETPNEHD